MSLYRAWGLNDLKALLEAHARYGAQWSNPGWSSGYNEFILDSRTHNARLPSSVQAFFVIKGQGDVTWNLPRGAIDTVLAHRRFLDEYSLSEREVPLVEFDPSNWHSPFSAA